MNKEEFKQERKKLGLSTQALAIKLGLSSKSGYVHIKKIECGMSRPSKLLINCFKSIIKQNNYDVR